MTTWRPVRDDDQLDPGDLVRFGPDARDRWGVIDEMHVVSDGPIGVTIRLPEHLVFSVWNMLLVHRSDLEVPR